MNKSTEKQAMEYLLPFYVNGSLSEDEKKQVELALSEHSDLREELNYLQQLREQVKQESRENSPGEFGLKRLQRSLQAEKAINNTQLEQTDISKEKNRWRIAAVAACLMLVVQTATEFSSSDTDSFQVANGPTTTATEKGQLVSVTFSEEATEQAIRQLLLKEKATIIGGPSALGIYHLKVTGDVTQFVLNLRAQTDLIESVQQE